MLTRTDLGGRRKRSRTLVGFAVAGAITAVLAVAGPATAETGTPLACPAAGHVTYTLTRAANPTADQTEAYGLITAAMDQALTIYNCQIDITKALTVSYNPAVATADGNFNGSIRFGARASMRRVTAMHEIAHTLGVGTVAAWAAHLSGGVWTGAAATAKVAELTGNQTVEIHGDAQHFWPYGLNYESEVTSENDLVIHCQVVLALRRDMGLS
ncbi:MAG TPA: hypothetical protein VGB74_00120 [Actinoplanes sp.]